MSCAAIDFFRKSFHHAGVRRYGANTLWLLAEKTVRVAVGFSVGVYVARSLGPAQYGLLNYAISFVALFSVFSSLGLDAILVRELVRTPQRANVLMGSSFLLKLGGFGIMAACVGIVLLFSGTAESRLLIWIILSGYFFQSFQVLDYFFQARVQGKYVAISQMAALLATAAGRVLLALNQAPLWSFALMETTYVLLASLCCWGFYRKGGACLRQWRFDRQVARELLRNCLPLMLAGAASLIAQEQALSLIAQKNAPGIQAMADQGILTAQDADAIQQLMGIYAPLKEGIAQAGALARDNRSWEILRQLSVTASMLEAFGLNGRIRLDFSLVNSMDYYNGVIFQGFLPNIPFPALSGGRYDNLPQKMGKQVGAIGFALYMGRLEQYFRQERSYDADVLLTYGPDADLAKLAAFAEALRAKGYTVRCQRESGQSCPARRNAPLISFSSCPR